MSRKVEDRGEGFKLQGTEFTTTGHVRQFDRLSEGFLIGRANRVVDSVASASGYDNKVQDDRTTLDFRVREFKGSSGPVTLETDSSLYMDGRDVGFMLRLWRAAGRIPALAVVEYRLDEETSEEWGAYASSLRFVPDDQEPATRPLAIGDSVHGHVKGPIDNLVVAMSRDLALAIESPEALRAHVESVTTETHLHTSTSKS